ncbi:MAG: Response regulator protein VraR [Chloroflexi bacterium ADurb.Bin360]|nr:MAG: Response regulator protein VraR [Chloroflexi bacterium ADurb.Bin360]
MLAVRGLYKGGEVILLEEVAFAGQCNVVVVFLDKDDSAAVSPEAIESLRERVRTRLGLTQSELDILMLAQKGMRNRAIAEHFNLSDGAIRNYLSSVYAKLEVSNRTEAVAEAIRLGLLDVGGFSSH